MAAEITSQTLPESIAPAMIELIDVTKQYRKTRALDGLTMRVRRGSIYGFVGPNGAGKTTTMRILATLLMPSSGSARIEGIDVARSPGRVRDSIGYMPDFFGVYDDMTVAEYLGFYAHSHGVPAKQHWRIIDDLLELIDLGQKRDEFVETLSRGMKQRLGLARCLVHNPAVLLLDEPASGLDPRARVEMRELLKELRNLGKTILISSHILPELADLCTDVGIIDNGKLVISGTVTEIMSRFGGQGIEVRVLDDLEAAMQVLAGQPNVNSVHRRDERTIGADFGGDDVAMHSLLMALVTNGVRVAHFGRVRGGLEDIFISITGRDTQKEGG